MKNTIIDFLVQFIISSLKLFSRTTRRKIIFYIAAKSLKLTHKTRKMAINNISNAMPWLNEEEVAQIVLSSYQTIAFGVMECFWLTDIKFKISCDDKTRRLLDSAGVSIATMHMSCYELAPFSIQQLTGSVATLSNIPTFIRSIKEVYRAANIKAIDKNQPHAFIDLLQAARDKHAICLHVDHYKSDVAVSFFNRKTMAPSGSAMLSSYSKAPLLLCYPILEKNGDYTLYIETISEKPVGSSKNEISLAMQKIYQRLETIILEYPNQWYWSYNRWRD
ncbi:MAG: lauroyl/myristoyl acyltransferase [Alteromonadaceae bacterium]|jgi:lauroyl/myristoyl acyltransferase